MRSWPARRTERAPLKHREGPCVFVDKPAVPMDNNRAKLALRSAVIGRALSFGFDGEKGADFTAMMYSVAGTLAIAGIDVRRWLKEWLSASGENGGKPPEDLSPRLPWSTGEARHIAAGSAVESVSPDAPPDAPPDARGRLDDWPGSHRRTRRRRWRDVEVPAPAITGA